MPMFQLIERTSVKLMHVNMRTEKHGKDRVDAYDIDMEIEGLNTDVLAMVDHPDRKGWLAQCFYFGSSKDGGMPELEGVQEITPHLRFPDLVPKQKLKAEMEDVDFTVYWGTARKESIIELIGGKSSVLYFECHEGGSVKLGFRFQTNKMPDGALDKLRKKLEQQIEVTAVQQEKLRQQAVIDGTVGHAGIEDAAKAEAERKAKGKRKGKDATQLHLVAQGEELGEQADAEA